MEFITHSLDATSVFHQYEPPSSLPLCDNGTLHHQAATINRLSVYRNYIPINTQNKLHFNSHF